MVHVWLDTSLVRDVATVTAIATALCAAGAEVVDRIVGRPGVVAFDVADANACSAIAETSKNGTERVLALPLLHPRGLGEPFAVPPARS